MFQSLTLGFWDSIGEFLMCLIDLIPKSIYIIFTAFTSGIDAIQALIRKLAGLDSYYTYDTGSGGGLSKDPNAMTTHFQQDPLSEFIYGILGIGNSAATYKALNTVFWSLAIFALILLVVTTMIAMIKSHYNEDYAQTNPWKYIYTAIKAVLTFAIIPLIMVFGLKLSSFVLVTLDNITAGRVTDDEIKQVYGTDGTNIFVSSIMAGSEDTKTYINYDFFGFGQPTTSTPMGSMLFKAAAYNCNRSRSGNISYTLYQNIKSGQYQIFGSDSSLSSVSASEEDKAEYVAYQIDYAFMNNLHLATSVSTSSIDSALNEEVRYKAALDVFSFMKNVKSFSKFNISAVWFFYDLWAFNYIVAFGGGFTMMGILLSIVLGLMIRLIKSAALFLIYPPLLAIAPLDNFKAFKSWATTLMQQILMSFGAIIGINILLLLLPFLQNIAFFNIPLIDAIVSMVLLIAGLIMAKDFISIVSGFVGGADANNVGGGLKGDFKGAFSFGAKAAGKIAGSTARTIGSAPITAGRMAIGGVRGGIKAGKSVVHAANSGKAKLLNEKNKQVGGMKNIYASGLKAGGLTRVISENLKQVKGKKADAKFIDAAAQKAGAAALKKADKQKGWNQDAKDAFVRQAIEKSLKSQKGSSGKSRYKELAAEEQALLKTNKSKDKNYAEKFNLFQKGRKIEDKMLRGKLKLKQNTDGSYQTVGQSFKGGLKTFWKGDGSSKAGVTGLFAGIGTQIKKGIDGLSLGKSMADGFTKAIGTLGEGTGIDKTMNGLKDIFKTSLTYHGGPFEAKKLEGDKLQKDIADKQAKESTRQTTYLKTVADTITELKRAQDAGNKTQSQILRAVSTGGSGSGGSGSGSGTP